MVGGLEGFELLARLTARLASTARLDDIVGTVLDEIVNLGFGAVWMAALDEATGNLHTLKEVIDGVDTTHEMPPIFMLDMRQPVGHGFRERRMINVVDPDALYIIEHDDGYRFHQIGCATARDLRPYACVDTRSPAARSSAVAASPSARLGYRRIVGSNPSLMRSSRKDCFALSWTISGSRWNARLQRRNWSG